jgi:predicted nucleic acid-binding protein
MTYYDTDVLVHFLHNQDEIKHTQELIEKSMVEDTFGVSWVNIQETGFVLSKLKESKQFITQKLSDFMTFDPLNYKKETFKRAI